MIDQLIQRSEWLVELTSLKLLTLSFLTNLMATCESQRDKIRLFQVSWLTRLSTRGLTSFSPFFVREFTGRRVRLFSQYAFAYNAS